MIVVGFDTGIVAAGLACVELGAANPRLVAQQRVATAAKDPIEARLAKIWHALARLILVHRPLVLGIEEQSGAQAGAFKRGDFNVDNSKTMMVAGLAVGCALAYGIPVVWVKPQAAKLAVTGKGGRSADKHQVKRAVAAICQVDVAELTEAGADAAAVAIAAGRLHRAWMASA